MLQAQSRGKIPKNKFGVIDPYTVTGNYVKQYEKDTEENIYRFLCNQLDREFIIFPYHYGLALLSCTHFISLTLRRCLL